MTIPVPFYYLPFICLWQSHLLIFPAIGITFLKFLVVAHHPRNQFWCLSLVHDQIMILIELNTRSGNVDDRLATMIISTLPSWSWPWPNSPCLGTLRARCLIFLGCSSDNSKVDASLQEECHKIFIWGLKFKMDWIILYCLEVKLRTIYCPQKFYLEFLISI